jgi:glucose-6-phosphate 1-dehydrogenase
MGEKPRFCAPTWAASWSMVAPSLDVWKALAPRNFPNHAAGTWGPKEADELIGRDGQQWRKINA